MTTLIHDKQSFESSSLNGLLTDDTFWPVEPRSLHELGLSISFVEALIIKTIHQAGTISGRNVATRLGLPFRIVEPVVDVLKNRKFLAHVRPAAFNDYYYSLTELGQKRGHQHLQQCSYIGPAPVQLSDYTLSVEAQAAGVEPINREQLRNSLSKISYQDELLDQLGPAINSNTGLFLF